MPMIKEQSVTKEQSAAAEMALLARFSSTLGPSMRLKTPEEKARDEAREQAETEAQKVVESEMRGVPKDESVCSIKDIFSYNQIPERLDPFTAALLGGCDPVSAHQALTLSMPILSFLGHNARVIYSDGTLRWVSGQSWQMGGSGCGKSIVLRSLENLFLADEIRRNAENAKEAAAYTLLPEKERNEKAMPQAEVHILDSIPTALALLQQIQINGGGAVYISCSECGEFGKKISNPYYSLVLDMMKKSYDGTGEAFMHKASDKTYYVPSMKLCCNIGGTIDPMYKIFRHCDADGTLSRGNLTILGERKDEKTEGPYRAPSWTREQMQALWQGADRLRNFNNTYYEDKTDFITAENRELFEKQQGTGGELATAQDLQLAVSVERRHRALRIPEIIAFGREIKEYLTDFGTEVIDDCCSRADERAMGLAYLLYIANGERAELLPDIIGTVRWWVKLTIDCAYAMQMSINRETRSRKDVVRRDFKRQGLNHAAREVADTRDAAFREFEARYEGQEKTLDDFWQIPVLRSLSERTVRRLVSDRGYRISKLGVYVITRHDADCPRAAVLG